MKFCERRSKLKGNGIQVGMWCNCRGDNKRCTVISGLSEVTEYLSGCCAIYPTNEQEIERILRA